MTNLLTSVLIYTASYCPWCDKAKDLLKSQGIAYTEVDVTDPQKRAEMMARSGGRRTIPQIFIGDYHVGGFDDLQALHISGKLKTMVKPCKTKQINNKK